MKRQCPIPYQLIISKKYGLGYARNWGALQAHFHLLIFFDDDIVLDKRIWKSLLSIERNEFGMLNHWSPSRKKHYPSSRVLVVHKEDFLG